MENKHKRFKFNKILAWGVLTSLFMMISHSTFAISGVCLDNHFTELKKTGYEWLDNEVYRTPPSMNTCPYVAMSLLLTYYDTYWNDSFVEEKYDWQSGTYNSATDTLIETFAAIEEAQDWEEYVDNLSLPAGTEVYPYYRSYAAEKEDDYLEPHLISIGKSLLFHTDPDETLGLNFLKTVAVLQAYLYIDRGFNINQVTVHYLHEDFGDIEAKMREVIDEGYPLIYLGQRIVNTGSTGTADEGQTKSGHQLIAFGYDNSGDIKLHTGWGVLNPVQTLSSTEYHNSRAVIWLEINEDALPHQCSNNYVDSVTGETLCACQIYSEHPNHNSNHLYRNCTDSDSHFLKCHCGEKTNIEAHDLTYSYYNPTQHYESCSGCAYAGVVTHDYSACIKISETQHETYCLCGVYGGTEAHYAYRFTKYNNSLHTTHCKCGKTWTEPHVVSSDAYDSGNRLAPCLACGVLVTAGTTLHPTMNGLLRTENGSFILPDGIIVLVDEDIEAYFAGTLEFYYPDDNLETE